MSQSESEPKSVQPEEAAARPDVSDEVVSSVEENGDAPDIHEQVYIKRKEVRSKVFPSIKVISTQKLSESVGDGKVVLEVTNTLRLELPEHDDRPGHEWKELIDDHFEEAQEEQLPQAFQHRTRAMLGYWLYYPERSVSGEVVLYGRKTPDDAVAAMARRLPAPHSREQLMLVLAASAPHDIMYVGW